MDGAFATETVYSGLISDQVKPKTVKVNIHSKNSLTFSTEWDSVSCKASTVLRIERLADEALLGDRKVPTVCCLLTKAT